MNANLFVHEVGISKEYDFTGKIGHLTPSSYDKLRATDAPVHMTTASHYIASPLLPRIFTLETLPVLSS